jgi:hypothetical protein
MRRKYAFIGIVLVMSAAVFVVLPGSRAETLRAVGFHIESGGVAPLVGDDSAARRQDVTTCDFSKVQHAIREQMCGQQHGAMAEDVLQNMCDQQAYTHPSMTRKEGMMVARSGCCSWHRGACF